MRILLPDVPRAVIDAEIRAATYPGHSPARWALPLLDELDALATGWQLVQLDAPDVSALWLPAHAGEACHGDVMRLGDGDGGATVADTAAWLELHGDAYAAANPSCWGRLCHAALGEVTAIVVSPASVGDRLKPDEAALVAVDGFHRVLGRWITGTRTCPAYLPVMR